MALPKKPLYPDAEELLETAVSELSSQIYRPNILSYEPWGNQTAFHESVKFGRILSGGNRAGKTDALVVEFARVAMNDDIKPKPEKWGAPDDPVQLRIVTVDITKGVEQIMIPKFKRWVPKAWLRGGSWESAWNKNDMILNFVNGSTIDFVTHGMDIGKMGGVPRHMIGFDEEPPQGIFNEGLMRLQDYDGRWVISATPQNGLEWIYDLIVEPASDPTNPMAQWVDVWELDASQNPYLKSDDRDRFFIGMNEEERDIREKGKFVSRSGLVFPEFSKHPEKFIVDREWVGHNVQWFSSVDSGWNNPTAWLWVVTFLDGSAHVVAEHYQSKMTVPEHSRIVKQKELELGVKEVRRTGDPAMKQKSVNDGLSPLMLYANEGLFIGVDSVPHAVEVGVQKLQQYFRLREDGKPMLTISPACPNLIRELKKLRWASYDSEKQNHNKNKQEVIHKKDDHAFDALRYWSTQMPDLRPTVDEILTREQKEGKTVDYYELLAMMRQNHEVEFVEDTRDMVLYEYTTDEMYYSEEAY